MPRSIRKEKNSRTAVYMDTHTHTYTQQQHAAREKEVREERRPSLRLRSAFDEN